MVKLESIDKIKNRVIRQFMCARKLRDINHRYLLSEDIVKFLLTLVGHEIVEKYPMRTSYLVMLIKVLYKTLVEDGLRLSSQDTENLYLKYSKFMVPQPVESLYYNHYILDDEKDLMLEFSIDSVITIKESNTIVSEGTTGLCTWEAGVALSIWCLRHPEKLQNKFIVELGAGTGLSGISACINCKPRKYWFTDCHLSVLDTIKDNIDINKLVHTFNCPYEVIKLSWENVEECERFDEEKPDLVIAADVIFDPTMFESLCQSLKYFTANSTTEAILFSTVRNPETHQTFLETLSKYNLDFTEEILPGNYSTIMEQQCPTNIINVRQQNVNMSNTI